MGHNLVLTKTELASQPLHEWLGPAAEHTVLLTPPHVYAASDPVQRKAFAGWYTTPDYHGTITELIGAEIVLDLSIARVASVGEFDVLRAARLRDMVGMPGQSFAAALRYRDKFLMKSLAGEAGQAVPRMLLVDAVGTLPHRLGEIGLPAVVKPRWMAASIGVKVVRDFSHCTELMQMLTGHVQPFELMVEQYIEAPLFHVDGLARDGSVLFAVASDYDAVGSAVLDYDSPLASALEAATGKVVAALGSPPHVQAFHAEFFVGEDGVPVLCEIASRAGGLAIPPIVEAVTGVDLHKESVLGQLGLEHSPLGPRRPVSAGYVSGAFTPREIPFEWVTSTRTRGRAFEAVVDGASHSEVRTRLAELSRFLET